jgi:hypothetical protein
VSDFDRIEEHRDLVVGLEYEASKRGDLCAACGFDLVAEDSDFCADCTRELGEVLEITDGEGSFRVKDIGSVDTGEAYVVTDPKHPRHYEVMADLWDNREKCA